MAFPCFSPSPAFVILEKNIFESAIEMILFKIACS